MFKNFPEMWEVHVNKMYFRNMFWVISLFMNIFGVISMVITIFEKFNFE